jgi:hypothetical protein
MPQDPAPVRSTAKGIPASSVLPSFRAIKPGDVMKGPLPVEEKTSWFSKLGQSAVALGGKAIGVFQGAGKRGASDTVKAAVGAKGLRELSEMIHGAEEQKLQGALMGNVEEKLQAQVSTASIAAGAEEAAAQSMVGSEGQVPEQGQKEASDVLSQQEDARRRQKIRERAALASAATPAKKSGGLDWVFTVLDPIPGFGQVSMLRKISKLF